MLEAGEASSSIKGAELVEILEAHAFDAIEVEGIIRELEARGFEVSEDDREPTAAPLAAPVETTTDALQLFLRETGRHPLLTAAQEVQIGRRIEAGQLDARRALDDNDSHPLLAATGDLVVTGPTNTNLLDLYLALRH